MFCYPGGIVSPDPFIWDDFIVTLDDLSDLDIDELISTTLGGWWSWYWGQRDENGPVLGGEDAYDTHAGLTLSVNADDGVLANDLDPESEEFIAVPAVLPQNGDLDLRPDGSFAYRPDAGFVGTDSFVYNAFDFLLDSSPVTVTINVLPPIADFDSDQLVTNADVDQLCAAVRDGNRDRQYDLNGDNRVSVEDHQYLIGNLLNTSAGDANLDGVFNSQDFVIVFSAALYETDSGKVAGWREGDWNCDGRFTSSDLVMAFTAGRYVSASKPDSSQVAAAVPDSYAAEDESGDQSPKLASAHRQLREKELAVV